MQSSENLLWIFRFSVEFEKQHPMLRWNTSNPPTEHHLDVVLHDSVYAGNAQRADRTLRTSFPMRSSSSKAWRSGRDGMVFHPYAASIFAASSSGSSANRCLAKDAKNALGSAAKALRPHSTAATAAVHNPPKGSHNVSPLFDAIKTIRRMNSKGF